MTRCLLCRCPGRNRYCAASPASPEHNSHSVLKKILFRDGKKKADVWPAAEVLICAALMVLQTAISSEQLHSQFMMCKLEMFKITLVNS